MISDLQVNKEKMLASANLGFICATDLADWLVLEFDIPFRQAHEISGKVVKFAEKNKCALHEISLDMFKKIDERINKDVSVSYTHLRAHETVLDIVCRLLL